MSRIDVTRWSTLAPVLSGALLVAGAIGEFLPDTAAILFATFFFVAHILFVFAVTGAYAHQVERMSSLGLAG